jgi:hypothetical protein
MVTSQPQRPAKINERKYFYMLGLLTGISFTFLGFSIVATIRSDTFDANVYQGIAGLLLAFIGLVPLRLMYSLRQHLPAGQREGLGWLSTFWTSLSLIMLSVSCGGMFLFSQKMLLIWLGDTSFLPDIVSGLFLVGALVFLWLGVKHLAPLYERWKQGQLETTSPTLPPEPGASQ